MVLAIGMANPSYAQSEKRGDQTERVRVTWMDSVGRMTFLGTENKIMVVFGPREWDVTEPSFRRQGWDPLVQRGTKRLRCGTRYGSAFSDWVSREEKAVGRNLLAQRFQSADAESPTSATRRQSQVSRMRVSNDFR